MSRSQIGAVTGVIVALLILTYAFLAPHQTSQSSGYQTLTTPGGVTFSYPDTYALAITAADVTDRSVIPPCDFGFQYCIYKHDNEYAGTNFESAGVRLNTRQDLTTEAKCTKTPPVGYDPSLKPLAYSIASAYANSIFGTGGGAAGHTAIGAVYRIWDSTKNICTEFEGRISKADYANYPKGSIKEFTDVDQAHVVAELYSIISSAMLGKTRVLWPAVTASSSAQ